METLLTGAVNRLLRRFIKSAGGEVGLDYHPAFRKFTRAAAASAVRPCRE